MSAKAEHRVNKIDVDVLDASPVSRWLADMWDGFDPWGSAMAEGFALCDWLTFEIGESVPSVLQYRPSPFGADTEDPRYEFVVEGYESGEFTVDDVVAYLLLLHDFIDACTAAGLDY